MWVAYHVTHLRKGHQIKWLILLDWITLSNSYICWSDFDLNFFLATARIFAFCWFSNRKRNFFSLSSSFGSSVQVENPNSVLHSFFFAMINRKLNSFHFYTHLIYKLAFASEQNFITTSQSVRSHSQYMLMFTMKTQKLFVHYFFYRI